MSIISDVREIAVEDIMRNIKHSKKQGYTYTNYYIPENYDSREARVVKAYITNKLTRLGCKVVNRPAMGRKIRISWE